jgi:hypothetical protein
MLFVWGTWMQKKWFILEDQAFDKDNISIQDFTVTLSNFPDEIEYGTLDNLKTELHQHLIKVLMGERQVIKSINMN